MDLILNYWILVLLWIAVHSDPGQPKPQNMPDVLAFPCGELVTGRRGEIKTPNFPGIYGDNLECTWTIQVDDNETITIKFLTFDVEKTWHGNSCADKFLVYDGPDTTSTQCITPSCGYEIPGPLHSSGNVLTLTFHSDGRTGKTGVRLKWKVSDKFTLHTEAKTWEEANAVCMNDGGHLAVKTNLNEQLIQNLLIDRSDNLWIGEYYTPWIWLQGCYKDPDLNLTSSKSYVETRENEAKVCQYHCQHTVYFGMREFECYCLTTEDMDKLQFSQTLLECKISCRGNNNERCGGAYSLTVYMNDVCWKNSTTWVARISKTISGKTCQAWSSDSPHAHAFHDDDMFPDGSEALASNYCRDPDGRGAPWCFTEDPNVQWQFCDAPPCPGTCWIDSTMYTGHLNVTVRGRKCRNWTDEPPTRNPAFHDDKLFPDSTVSEAANFCRSPNTDPLLWCYLDSAADGPWDYCGSPPCFDSTEFEEKGELCRLFWVKDSKFYFKEHNCEEVEHFWCFVDEEVSDISLFIGDISRARQACNLRYSLSNYKTLFGLINADSRKFKDQHWLGNVRGEDNTYNKGGVITPSACKTIEKTSDGLTKSFQPNCQLPLGFICQKVAVLCGGKFYNDSGNITSPGYPDEYENNDYCEWEINVSEGKSIEIVFHDVDIEQSNTCSFDYIEIFEFRTNSSQRIGQKLCGTASNVTIISASNHVLIKFRSDKDGRRKGFYMEWMSELIPTTTSTTISTTGTIAKQAPSTTKENLMTVTNRIIGGAPGTEKTTIGGATLAGIVVGSVLTILVIVVVVLVVMVLRRKKERKAEAQTILELKALESTATATTPSNSETPQPDVYSTPIPKVLRQPQQPVSDDHVQPNSGDNSYYHHLHQTNINKAIPGESRNPYGRLHTPDLYDHTADSETHQTGDTYDHFDSDRNDSLDKDCKGINPDSCDSQRSHQYPDVYEYTTGAVCPHDHEAYNRVQADETNSLHNEDNDNINNEYMTMTSNNGSNENSTKDTRNTENYLTPIGEHLNNTMGHTNTADIEEKRSNETDGYDEEVNIEDDTYYNVSDDKTDEQTADSDQHLYEIEDTGQVYDNLNN